MLLLLLLAFAYILIFSLLLLVTGDDDAEVQINCESIGNLRRLEGNIAYQREKLVRGRDFERDVTIDWNAHWKGPSRFLGKGGRAIITFYVILITSL